MRLLHPMMIYISEELYQKLPSWPGKSESICIAKFPQANDQHIFKGVEGIDQLLEVITDVRKIVAKVNLPPKSNPPVHIQIVNGDQQATELIQTFGTFISALGKVGEVSVLAAGQPAPKGCISVLSAKNFTVNVEVAGFIKVEDEVKKIQAAISEKEKASAALRKKVTAADYEKKVPKDVQIKEKEKLDLYDAEIKTLQANIELIKAVIN